MMKNFESSQMASQLNNLAWIHFENMHNTEDTKQALIWSSKSLEYERGIGYLDTYANLLNKLGRKEEAIKIQQEAIDLSRKAGNDVTELEKTLIEMKK